MGYDYIRDVYGIDVRLGARVVCRRTGLHGTVRPKDPEKGNYVQVLFDGSPAAEPVHPTLLELLPDMFEAAGATAGGAGV